MSILGDPTQRSPDRGSALQKYLLLHSQHDALQRHLDCLSQCTSTTTTSPSTSPFSNSPPSPSYITHPTRHHRSTTIPTSFIPHPISPIPEQPSSKATSRPTPKHRRSSLPSDLSLSISIPTTTTADDEIAIEERNLQDVNQQIKMTLTELLNCESVKGDQRYRMWIQTRLMDAERELKYGRSRSRSRSRRGSIVGFGEGRGDGDMGAG